MEYDNDRLVKKTYGIEITCWVLLALINPVLNSLSIFPQQPKAWPLLMIISLLLLPVYMVYARLAVPAFLFKRRYALFAVTTALFFTGTHLVLYLFYLLAGNIISGPAQVYFTYSGITLARESSWIIFTLMLSVAIAWYRLKLEEEDALKALQQENTFYKIRYFRTQLNPHFLFNTLNSIYSLSLNNTARTPEVIIRLSDIMRFLIYECNEEKIPLDKEIEFIKNYIEIERIRYDADIKFTLEGDTEGVMIEPFLFISFIENGFKHAIDNSFAKPFIYITLKVSAYQVALNVINNTSIELETQAKKMRGRGLENSKSVLELLYPEAYALDIIQTEVAARKESKLRLKNAQERLERLYPDTHTLDVILNNNSFTVSLILLNNRLPDKVHHYRR